MQSSTRQRRMTITVGPLKLTAELQGTPSADALWNALPLCAQAHRWGDEIYFNVGFHAPLEAAARAVIEEGEIAYWPDGPALCFFFGPTPVSRQGEIRAAGPVNICGRILGDSTMLRQAHDGSAVHLAKAPA